MQRLIYDLRRREVSPEGHLARRTELTCQRAARLGGEAQRAASVAIAHEHRLHRMAVARAKERFDRAVAGLPLELNREGRERDAPLELDAQAARQIGHRGVAGGAARRPRPDLAAAEGRLAELCECGFEEPEVHA